jgi:tetratricopeptide (TPR) repeat protein
MMIEYRQADQLTAFEPNGETLFEQWLAAGQTLIAGGAFQVALDAYETALRTAATAHSSLQRQQVAHVFLAIGNCYGNLKETRRAISFFQRALQVLQQQSDWESLIPEGIRISDGAERATAALAIQCLEALAQAHDQLDERSSAAAYYREALTRAAYFGDAAAQQRLYQSIIAGHARRSDWGNVQQVAREGMALAEHHQQPSDLLQHLRWLAHAQHQQGQLAEALTSAEHALQLARLAHDSAVADDEIRYATLLNEHQWQQRPSNEVLLNVASTGLTLFAQQQCGTGRTRVQVVRNTLIGPRFTTEEVVRWSVGYEQLEEFSRQFGWMRVRAVVLDFYQHPEALVRVSVGDGPTYRIALLLEQSLRAWNRSALVAVQQAEVPAEPEALQAILNRWLIEGWLLSDGERLRARDQGTGGA